MRHLVASVVFSLVACSDPRSTKLPADLADFSKIQASLDKLDSADRTRVAAYEMRARLGGIFGGSAPAAGGVTIGQAIDNQKAFEAAQAKEEAAGKALAAKVRADRARQLALMSQVLTTALTKLEVEKASFMGPLVYADLAFQNHGTKSIAGVKGTAILRDMFGDTLATRAVSYDKGIPVNGVKELRELVTAGFTGGAKLATTPIEKVKFSFEPSIIIFEDGTKLEAPAIDR